MKLVEMFNDSSSLFYESTSTTCLNKNCKYSMFDHGYTTCIRKKIVINENGVCENFENKERVDK